MPTVISTGPISLARKIERCMSLSLRRHDPDQVLRVTSLGYLSPGRQPGTPRNGRNLDLSAARFNGEASSECGEGSGADGGVQFFRRHRMRQKHANGAVGNADQCDGKLVAAARIVREEAFRGIGNCVENIGCLLRGAGAAFLRSFVEKVVAPVREQQDAAGMIRAGKTGSDERGFDGFMDSPRLSENAAELRTEAFGGG